jgi:hypothetical protein
MDGATQRQETIATEKKSAGEFPERSKKTRKLRRMGICLVWLMEVEEKAVKMISSRSYPDRSCPGVSFYPIPWTASFF